MPGAASGHKPIDSTGFEVGLQSGAVDSEDRTVEQQGDGGDAGMRMPAKPFPDIGNRVGINSVGGNAIEKDKRLDQLADVGGAYQPCHWPDPAPMGANGDRTSGVGRLTEGDWICRCEWHGLSVYAAARADDLPASPE